GGCSGSCWSDAGRRGRLPRVRRNGTRAAPECRPTGGDRLPHGRRWHGLCRACGWTTRRSSCRPTGFNGLPASARHRARRDQRTLGGGAALRGSWRSVVMSRKRTVVGVLTWVAAGLLLAACGGGGNEQSTATVPP